MSLKTKICRLPKNKGLGAAKLQDDVLPKTLFGQY